MKIAAVEVLASGEKTHLINVGGETPLLAGATHRFILEVAFEHDGMKLSPTSCFKNFFLLSG